MENNLSLCVWTVELWSAGEPFLNWFVIQFVCHLLLLLIWCTRRRIRRRDQFGRVACVCVRRQFLHNLRLLAIAVWKLRQKKIIIIIIIFNSFCIFMIFLHRTSTVGLGMYRDARIEQINFLNLRSQFIWSANLWSNERWMEREKTEKKNMKRKSEMW